jgi:hypothetical protein
LTKKSVTPVKSDSAFMPARQTFTPSPKKRDDCRICRVSAMRHLHDCLRLWFREMEISQSRFGVQYRFG